MNSFFCPLLFVSLVLLTGCIPESKNDLPDKHLQDDDRVIGNFSRSETKDTQKGARIEKLKGKKGHYVLIPNEPLEEKLSFRLYKIGNSNLGSICLNQDNPVYLFFLLSGTENQIRFSFLDREWLLKNPNALPGTEFINDKKTLITASSEELFRFFQTHAHSEGIFDPNKAIQLTRNKN